MKKTIDLSPRLTEILRTDEAHLADHVERTAYLFRNAMRDIQTTFNEQEWNLLDVATYGAKYDAQIGPIETIAGRVTHEITYGDAEAWADIDVTFLLTKVRGLDLLSAWAIVEVLETIHAHDQAPTVNAWWTLAARKTLLNGTAAKAGPGRPGPGKFRGKKGPLQRTISPAMPSQTSVGNGTSSTRDE